MNAYAYARGEGRRQPYAFLSSVKCCPSVDVFNVLPPGTLPSYFPRYYSENVCLHEIAVITSSCVCPNKAVFLLIIWDNILTTQNLQSANERPVLLYYTCEQTPFSYRSQMS